MHRDLKPANVVLTRSGAKLLDFGLAKTAAPAVAAGSMSMRPTASPQTLTARGMILGTFQYMAPEQIEGAEADARTDIFAFGCVLLRDADGQKAFEGKTHASLIAAILEREPPPVTTLQPLAPPLLDAIVRKCLAKKADDRWQNVADLATALHWAADAPSSLAARTNAIAGTPAARPRRIVGISALAAAVLVMFATGAIAWRYATNPTTRAATVKFEIVPPPDVLLSPAPVASAAQLAISPDGRRLVFVAASNHGVAQLWVRALNGVQARPLAGTEGASFPFWSPDSRSIAFFAGGKLKKVDTMGGAPVDLCDVVGGRGGAWGPDGTIVFSAPRSPMSRVAASGGGAVRPATTLNRDQGATGHNWPQFLPDGRHYLFYQISSKPEHQGIYVASLDSADNNARRWQ